MILTSYCKRVSLAMLGADIVRLLIIYNRTDTE